MAIEDILVSKALVSFNLIVADSRSRVVFPVIKRPDHKTGQSLAFIAEGVCG
jgi:hypothetical protein